MMAAARHWHTFNDNKKCAWRKRASKLNSMPVPGKFRSFPKTVSKQPRIIGNRMLEELVFDSLSGDWEMVGKLMKSAIYRCPKIDDSKKVYCFGTEKVVMQNQVYRSFHLNKLLKSVLFGIGFEKINKD